MEARQFYDSLASSYHLVYGDWDDAIQRQSQAIGRILAAANVIPPDRVLDCACGVGTQAIGLTLLGYRVTATDISSRAVARAQGEFRKRRLGPLTARVNDMRHLPPEFNNQFAAVVCMDNPLAHLLTEADLRQAFESLFRSLRPGGKLVLSSRDYDSILRDKPTQTPIRRSTNNNRETVVLQLWTWDPTEPIYKNEHFIIQSGPLRWTVRHFPTTMRAYRKTEISHAAEGAGFESMEWKAPDQSGFFQPLMLATKPA